MRSINDSAKGIETEVFVISNSGILRKIDGLSTGVIRMHMACALLPSLAKFDVAHVQFTLPLGFILTIIKRVGLIEIPIVVHTLGDDVFSFPEITMELGGKK